MSATPALQVEVILAAVFQHLIDDSTTLCNARLVNRIWAAEALPFFWHIATWDGLAQTPPSRRQYYASNIRILRVTGGNNRDVDAAVASPITFPRLQKLILLQRPLPLVRFAGRCTSLRQLDVWKYYMETDFSQSDVIELLHANASSLQDVRLYLYSNLHLTTHLAKVFGQQGSPRPLERLNDIGPTLQLHSQEVPQPVVAPFCRLRKLDFTAEPKDIIPLLELLPRTLSELSLCTGGRDDIVALFRVVADFRLLTSLDVNMISCRGSHVGRDALLALANLRWLRTLKLHGTSSHIVNWATTDIDDADLARIFAALPCLTAFELLLSHERMPLRMAAALKSAGEHCRGLTRFHVRGRLCLVSLPKKWAPPLFPALEELRCDGFDYSAMNAARGSRTGKTKARDERCSKTSAVDTAQRILCHAPKLQRLELTNPKEEDNKVLELWNKWATNAKGLRKQ
jgi:hypothetical protein